MFPRSVALCLAATVFFALPAASQTRPAASPPRPAAAPAPQPLARSVFLGNMDQEFLKMDADKNGQVTGEEAAAFQRSAVMAAAGARNRALFQQLDADRNGQVSPTEFQRLISPPPPQVNGQQFIASMDSNRDGKVSLVEHRASTVANFDKIDTDQDGVVTPAEMRAAGLNPR